eukprot:scaffold119076_cov15-Tisochrysis_lutea.AAC.2
MLHAGAAQTSAHGVGSPKAVAAGTIRAHDIHPATGTLQALSEARYMSSVTGKDGRAQPCHAQEVGPEFQVCVRDAGLESHGSLRAHYVARLNMQVSIGLTHGNVVGACACVSKKRIPHLELDVGVQLSRAACGWISTCNG